MATNENATAPQPEVVKEALKTSLENAPKLEGRVTLSPADNTRVKAAIAFHVNGHRILIDNPNGVKQYQQIHGELLLNNFYRENLDTINKLGQLPAFSFFRQIHDDLIGKKVTALLINGLLVTGYLGVNGYNGEVFRRELPLGPIEGEGLINVRPKPIMYIKMKTDVIDELTGEPKDLIEETSFVTVICVNDRIPVDEIPLVNYDHYVAIDAPIMMDKEKNSKIIKDMYDAAAVRKKHEALQDTRRKKNKQAKKSRRQNRK